MNVVEEYMLEEGSLDILDSFFNIFSYSQLLTRASLDCLSLDELRKSEGTLFFFASTPYVPRRMRLEVTCACCVYVLLFVCPLVTMSLCSKGLCSK